MNIKALNLDMWMTVPWMLEECREGGNYPEQPVVFNRDGLYKHGVACWFECGGKAYRYPPSRFEHQMAMLDAERITVKQAIALSGIIQQKLATKEQRAMYHRYCDMMQLRSTFRGSYKMALRIRRDREAK